MQTCSILLHILVWLINSLIGSFSPIWLAIASQSNNILLAIASVPHVYLYIYPIRVWNFPYILYNTTAIYKKAKTAISRLTVVSCGAKKKQAYATNQ